jgi:AraC-like DNA-binding protein/CheY-like chemotaxis protein
MTKVLTIDDHQESCEAIAGLLRLEGFDAEIATTGGHGLAWALVHPVDLILVDLHLSDMSGIDVVRTLRTHGISTPIFITTAFPDLDDSFDAQSVGASGYIEGLLLFDQLLHVVRSALAGRAGGNHAAQSATLPGPGSASLPPQALGSGVERRIRYVVRALDNEGETPWSITTLADRVRLSNSRLRHLFAETMGMPLSRFIRMRRLHRLAQRLIKSSDSIALIVSEVHLPNDLRRMRDAFRRRFGMTPMAYRQRFRRMPAIK